MGGASVDFSSVELRGLLARTTYESPPTLDARTRVALFHGTTVKNEELLALADGELTMEFLLRHGVRATNVLVSGITCHDLRRMGTTSSDELLKLGVDALTLVVSPSFAQSAVEAFSVDEVKTTFLRTAIDAVALAGEKIAVVLGLTPADLLACCDDNAHAAVAVLQQLGPGSLAGVTGGVLAATGVDAAALKQVGISLNDVLRCCAPSNDELSKLKYNF